MGYISNLFGSKPPKNKTMNSKYYFERGHRIKKGSKLDRAIKLYKKKGYYVTRLSSTGLGPNQDFMKEPPTLRPVLHGGTFHRKNYHHPLAERGGYLDSEDALFKKYGGTVK